MLVKWFPLQHQPKRAFIKIDSTISAIFIIDICIDNHPFKVFINRKKEGLEISNVVWLERPIDWGDVLYEQGLGEVFMK